MNKLLTIILLAIVALAIRAILFPPDPIHIESVTSMSGVEYVCIYESEDDFRIAKLDAQQGELR